ncbi:DEAD/DEAH box helicase [Mesobacillus harenae]|uniref:DEAD/DEAH box helicase n=1 Tax=Mesobacillus harenae TaxID=2213203 RepID=UPI0018DA1A52|nr:DEAD/DEAH box helicase [Mesobacillus harenae]
MRFAVYNNRLVPEPLLPSAEKTEPISKLPTIPLQPLNPDFPFNPDLQTILTGKQLLLDELPFELEEIQTHYENGFLAYRKSIELKGKQAICIRCGTKDPAWFASYPCARCKESCTYCRQCLMMGRVSSCTPLISWTGPEPEAQPAERILNWAGSLSKGQKEASSRVVEAVETDSELLVWAVCGAGKTEVLFAGIAAALAEGKRVCVATPRTDVVLELTPRFKAVFPHTTIASLYGGSEDRQKHAQLTIATTHQLLRFYQAFDFMVVDEVDAFPYSVDAALQYAVKQARKQGSALVFLTATPNQKWQQECLSKKRAFVTIPARYHRFPLPVPVFVWCGNWQKHLQKNKLPSNVLNWIKHRINSGNQALVFVPQIEQMEKLLPLLQTLHPDILSVHAEDPYRKEKVQKMRNKEVPILLTTTILERGVTFPNIDVAVLGAEDRIFAESALVQIAGRAGRSKNFPSGDVTFFHYGKTEAMVRARNQILKMNQVGKQRGLLD